MRETLPEIIEQCKRGDEVALRELVRRFHGWAHDLAASLLDSPHLADDVVQEAFCVTMRSLPQLKHDNAFPAWLRQVVRRTAMQANKRSREVALPQGGDWSDDRPGVDARLETDELRSRVRAAVQSLPEGTRSALELFYFEERSCREVADMLHIPNGTVKRRLHDGRQKLRDLLLHLDEDGTDTSRAAKPPL